MIKYLAKNKYKIVVFILVVLMTAIICNIVVEKKKKNQYENNIIIAAETGNKYMKEKNDVNREMFIKKLKELNKMYLKIKKEKNSIDAKLLAIGINASYDILEERKENAKNLSDLLTAIELLKKSPLDESGEAGEYILRFVTANSKATSNVKSSKKN